MSTDDLADSEMSFGSVENGPDQWSVGSLGSANGAGSASGARVLAGPGPQPQRKHTDLRRNHAKCIEVLRRKAGGEGASKLRSAFAAGAVAGQTAAAFASAGSDSKAMTGDGFTRQITAEGMVRQSTSDSVGSDYMLTRAVTMPAMESPSQECSLASQVLVPELQKESSKAEAKEETLLSEVLVERVDELRQETIKDLASFRDVLEAQTRGLEAFREQDTPQQLAALRKAVEAQAGELNLLRAQETHVALRAARDSVETCDKMGAQRQQEMHIALDRLREALRIQSRELAVFKELGAGVQAVQEGVKAQSLGLTELQPVTLDLCKELAAARQTLDTQAAALEGFAAQVREQHQEHLDELQRLRQGLLFQAQCDAMRAELETLRRREAQESAGGQAAGADREGGRNQHVGRMPREAVPLAIAAALGALFPVLVSGALRAVWAPALTLTPSLRSTKARRPVPLSLLPGVRRAALAAQRGLSALAVRRQNTSRRPAASTVLRAAKRRHGHRHIWHQEDEAGTLIGAPGAGMGAHGSSVGGLAPIPTLVGRRWAALD